MEEKSEVKTKDVPDCCKAGGKESRNYIMPAILGILLLISIFQAVQINAMKSITGNAVKAISAPVGANGVDMTGWTEDEKMMYEHHGTLPDRLQQQGQPQETGMVGGC